jgi:uncharacterized membrane protein
MDRLDFWLNRQGGLRRVLLTWLHLCIPTTGVGSALWSLFGRGTPGLGLAFLQVVGWSVVVAAALAGLTVYLGRTSTPKRYVFSWRVSVGMLLFFGALELNVLTDQQADWPRTHRAIAIVTLLLIAASITFVLMAVSRYRRQSMRLADGQIH